MDGKKITFLFLVILLSSFVIGEIKINEIMYNPEGSDNNREFIEIFFENQIDLTGYTIADNHSNDTLTLLKYTTSNYALIVEEAFNHSNINASIYSVGATIGNNLGNSEDKLFFYDANLTLIDTFYYNKSFGAYGDGDSLQHFNGSWCASFPTPSEENYCPPPQSFTLSCPLDVLNDGTVFLVRANVFNFPWGNYDIKVDIKDENGSRIGRIYNENEKKWKSTNYYLNNAFSVGNEIKEHLLYLKIDSDKEYTGTAILQGRLRDSLITPFYVFRVIDSKLEDSLLEEETKETDSSIEIFDSDSEIKFGEILRVKINVYRGDTRKYAVNSYVEINGKKVSEKITMHFKDKFTGYTLTVPIQLNPNCDEKIKEGKAVIIVEGLDTETEEKITISGIDDNLCKFFLQEETKKEPVNEIPTKEVQTDESGGTVTSLSENSVVDVPSSNQINEKKKAILDEITGVVVYKSSSEKAKNLIPSVLIAVLCLVCLCLLFRR